MHKPDEPCDCPVQSAFAHNDSHIVDLAAIADLKDVRTGEIVYAVEFYDANALPITYALFENLPHLERFTLALLAGIERAKARAAKRASAGETVTINIPLVNEKDMN